MITEGDIRRDSGLLPRLQYIAVELAARTNPSDALQNGIEMNIDGYLVTLTAEQVQDMLKAAGFTIRS